MQMSEPLQIFERRQSNDQDHSANSVLISVMGLFDNDGELFK